MLSFPGHVFVKGWENFFPVFYEGLLCHPDTEFIRDIILQRSSKIIQNKSFWNSTILKQIQDRTLCCSV